MFTLRHNAPEKLVAGLVYATGVESTVEIPGFRDRVAELVRVRSEGLSDEDDTFRKLVRDIFRNGRYKPTGRGKPASEYLLRSAIEGTFPEINTVVDICNYISLRSLMPVSIWDVDRSGSNRFCIRLGQPGEEYIFNSSGQTIGLEDLIVGCVVTPERPDGKPIVNAVKDSMTTKTTDSTSQTAAIVYGPSGDSHLERLTSCCREYAILLGSCGPSASAAFRILRSGEEIQI